MDVTSNLQESSTEVAADGSGPLTATDTEETSASSQMIGNNMHFKQEIPNVIGSPGISVHRDAPKPATKQESKRGRRRGNASATQSASTPPPEESVSSGESLLERARAAVPSCRSTRRVPADDLLKTAEAGATVEARGRSCSLSAPQPACLSRRDAVQSGPAADVGGKDPVAEGPSPPSRFCGVPSIPYPSMPTNFSCTAARGIVDPSTWSGGGRVCAAPTLAFPSVGCGGARGPSTGPDANSRSCALPSFPTARLSCSGARQPPAPTPAESRWSRFSCAPSAGDWRAAVMCGSARSDATVPLPAPAPEEVVVAWSAAASDEEFPDPFEKACESAEFAVSAANSAFAGEAELGQKPMPAAEQIAHDGGDSPKAAQGTDEAAPTAAQGTDEAAAAAAEATGAAKAVWYRFMSVPAAAAALPSAVTKAGLSCVGRRWEPPPMPDATVDGAGRRLCALPAPVHGPVPGVNTSFWGPVLRVQKWLR